jgi:hypothetical protein
VDVASQLNIGGIDNLKIFTSFIRREGFKHYVHCLMYTGKVKEKLSLYLTN